MVAILLLIVGVLAALSMVSTSMKANSTANVLSVKTALAQQVMEYILSLDSENTECDPYLDTSPYVVLITGSAGKKYNLNRNTSSACPGNFIDDEGNKAAGSDRVVKGAGTFSAQYSTVPDVTTGLTRVEVQVSRLPKDPNPVRLICRKKVN